MLAKFNLFCNIAILAILLAIGAYKPWEPRENWKQKAALAESDKRMATIKEQMKKDLAEQDKNIKEQLRIDFDGSDGVYICFRESVFANYMKPREMVKRYNVLYPIKGDLQPGDRIDAINMIEALENETFFRQWTRLNRITLPIEIVFISCSSSDSAGEKTKAGTNPHAKRTFVDMTIRLDENDDRCKLFLEVLNEMGWCTQTPYFKTAGKK